MTRSLSLAILATAFGLAACAPLPAEAHRGSHHRHVDVVRVLPSGHHRIVHAGVHYGFHAGRFYSHRGDGWVVVRPPLGAIVPVLPRHVDVVVRGPHRHYRFDGVEYRRAAGGWVVVRR